MKLSRTDYLNLKRRYRMKLINDIFNLNKEIDL